MGTSLILLENDPIIGVYRGIKWVLSSYAYEIQGVRHGEELLKILWHGDTLVGVFVVTPSLAEIEDKLNKYLVTILTNV